METEKNVTIKNVKRQEAGRKAYQTHLQKVKEDILKNNTAGDSTTRGIDRGSNSTSDSSNSTSDSSNSTSDSSDRTSTIEYIYHYGTLPIILMAVGLIFWFQKKKTVEKKPIEKKKRVML